MKKIGVTLMPSLAAVRHGSSDELPTIPPGFAFLTDESGAYLTDTSGNLLIFAI